MERNARGTSLAHRNASWYRGLCVDRTKAHIDVTIPRLNRTLPHEGLYNVMTHTCIHALTNCRIAAQVTSQGDEDDDVEQLQSCSTGLVIFVLLEQHCFASV